MVCRAYCIHVDRQLEMAIPAKHLCEMRLRGRLDQLRGYNKPTTVIHFEFRFFLYSTLSCWPASAYSDFLA